MIWHHPFLQLQTRSLRWVTHNGERHSSLLLLFLIHMHFYSARTSSIFSIRSNPPFIDNECCHDPHSPTSSTGTVRMVCASLQYQWLLQIQHEMNCHSHCSEELTHSSITTSQPSPLSLENVLQMNRKRNGCNDLCANEHVCPISNLWDSF